MTYRIDVGFAERWVMRKTWKTIVAKALTRMRKPKKKKSEKTLTLPEAHEAWERFWSNTRILGFELDEEGEKRAIRTGIQRVMPGGSGLDFRKKK